MKIDLAHALVDLWSRRHEPVDHDVPRALHLAGALEDDPNAPTHLLGFAWNLVDEMLQAAEWSLPETKALVRCRSTATSIRHSSALLLEDIAAQIAGTEAPVLILGALGAGRSLLGRWDLVPASGAMLVALDGDSHGDALAPAVPGQQGIRWARAGGLAELLGRHSRKTEIAGVAVRVPSPPLIAARIADPPGPPGDISSFLFCAAAHAAIQGHQWDVVRPIAVSIGRGAAVREASVHFRLEDHLDVHIPAVRKLAGRIRHVVRPALAARIFS